MVEWKRYRYGMVAILTALLCGIATPAIANFTHSFTHSTDDQFTHSTGDHQLIEMGSPSIHPPFLSTQGLIERGRNRYNAGQFNEAVRLLQQAVDRYAAEGNDLQQAIALSNLCLAHQSLGNWDEANTAIKTSLQQLNHLEADMPGKEAVMAQVLTIHGRLQFAQGQYRAALDTWKPVTQYYHQQGNQLEMIDSQINQTQALQALGFYKRAIEQLEDIQETLKVAPDSPTKVSALRSLGKALRIAGYLGNPTLQDIPNDDSSDILGLLGAGAETGVRGTDQPLNATQILVEAWGVAERVGMDEAIAQIAINLGDIAQAQALNPALDYEKDDWLTKAMSLYDAAIARSSSPQTQIDARLRQFRLSINSLSQRETAQRLRTQIQLQLQSLPPSRTTIYQRVDLAQNLINFKQALSASSVDSTIGLTPRLQPIQWAEIVQLLTIANQQAERLQDKRVQASVLGALGSVYEKASQDFAFTGSVKESTRLATESESLTQWALQLSLAQNASDIAYQWYWQLARLRKQAQDRTGAIAAYDESLKAIQSIRTNLTGVDQNVQFSFRDNIEPIHREFVALLLEPDPITKDSPSESDIDKARRTIENLQLAELDNYFRESCLNAKEVNISDIDQQAAVIYPIILRDRLEVILNLPNSQTPAQNDIENPQTIEITNATNAIDRVGTTENTNDIERSNMSRRSLIHITQSSVSLPDIEENTRQIRRLISNKKIGNDRKEELKQRLSNLYTWLIDPFANELEQSNIKTLVFVLDGTLRSIPIAALFDGNQYLIEKYSITLTPGLQLTESAPPNVQELEVLMGGLSEARGGFGALPNVNNELDRIADTVTSSQRLFNEQFTNAAIQNRISRSSSPVVHLATHGQFSDQFDNTYLLTWDTRLNIRELSTLLQSSELNRRRPIELLVLSACKTASGSSRAALGLAGMAVRSGARSTLATLWNVDDESTSEAMQVFYKTWVSQKVTKVEALRQAQLSLLNRDDFSEPYYWAPFVLLGNWL